MAQEIIKNKKIHGNKGRVSPFLGKKHSVSSKLKMSRIRKKLIFNGKIKLWNKGLTSETDSRVLGKERCPGWKGGITSEMRMLRACSAYKIWRQLVFVRDNFTCKECGQIGGWLESHHIKPFSLFEKLRFDINNGVTLCNKCHIKIDKYRGVRLHNGIN